MFSHLTLSSPSACQVGINLSILRKGNRDLIEVKGIAWRHIAIVW